MDVRRLARGWYGKQPKRLWLAHSAERLMRSRSTPPSTDSRSARPTRVGGGGAETISDSPCEEHRYLTHNKKLIDVEEPVARVREQAEGLGRSSARCYGNYRRGSTGTSSDWSPSADSSRPGPQPLSGVPARVVVHGGGGGRARALRDRELHLGRGRLAAVGRGDGGSGVRASPRPSWTYASPLRGSGSEPLGGAGARVARRGGRFTSISTTTPTATRRTTRCGYGSDCASSADRETLFLLRQVVLSPEDSCATLLASAASNRRCDRRHRPRAGHWGQSAPRSKPAIGCAENPSRDSRGAGSTCSSSGRPGARRASPSFRT